MSDLQVAHSAQLIEVTQELAGVRQELKRINTRLTDISEGVDSLVTVSEAALEILQNLESCISLPTKPASGRLLVLLCPPKLDLREGS